MDAPVMLTLKVERSFKRRLRLAAAEEAISMSELVRRALEESSFFAEAVQRDEHPMNGMHGQAEVA